MRSVILGICVASLLLGLLGVVQPASAVMIEIAGGTEFFDDFEGVVPSGGDDDPVAGTGTWAVYDGATPIPASVQVVTGGIGAFEGSNFLKVSRPSEYAYARGQTADKGVAGDVLYAEFMAYFPTGRTGDSQITMNSGQAGADAWGVVVKADGSVINSFGGAVTGLDVTFDTWEKWEWDRTQGDTSGGTLTIAGNSATVAPRDAPYDDDIVGALYFDNRTDGDLFYLDAVPEPATLSLACLGGLIMLGRRRHQA